MRLFGKVDGTIDRFDRAGWLTWPFDMSSVVQATRSLCYTECTVSPTLGFTLVSAGTTLGATTSTELTLQGSPSIGCPGD